MKIKNALENIPASSSSEEVLHTLYTPWGESLDGDHVWEEYPRPQLRRQNYHILNGYWDYKFTSMEEDKDMVDAGTPFLPDGLIVVPFSPESLLSGVGRQLKPEEYLWYQRVVIFEDDLQSPPDGMKCLLHFGAVDQTAQVFINGVLTISHVGGYLPFTIDITDYAKEGSCLIQVRVRDESDTSYHTRGKQTLNRGGMFYTAQSGIWQTVWYEWVPKNHIISMKITPDYDNAKVDIELLSFRPFDAINTLVREPCIFAEADIEWSGQSQENPSKYPQDCTQTMAEPASRTDVTTRIISVSSLPQAEEVYSDKKDSATTLTHLQICFPKKESSPAFQPWAPDSPMLYPFSITADSEQVESYFAMRCFTIEKAGWESGGNGHLRFCLNHAPLFLHGILDQGYWSDGLMTAPCDEAFLYDIRLAKEYGFNMIRKHIKLEPLRWYYHCDRLGMLVWQDMVSGGTTYHMPLVCYLPTVFPRFGYHIRDHHYKMFSRQSAEGRLAWEQECLDTVRHLSNVPSLAVWVPFNEGWGQFDAARIAKLVKKADPTRLVDHASGWFDQKEGDFRSIHNYFRNLRIRMDGKRAFVISEYGGYACRIEGHSSIDRVYGYQKYADCESLSDAYYSLLDKKLFPLEKKGLSGAVYTQLSDVEEEVNGLVTYDRRVIKIKPTD